MEQENFDDEQWVWEDLTLAGGGPNDEVRDPMSDEIIVDEVDHSPAEKTTTTTTTDPATTTTTTTTTNTGGDPVDLKKNTETNIEKYNSTGEPPTEIYNSQDYNIWKDAGADKYPVKFISPKYIDKPTRPNYIIVDPMTASAAERLIASQPVNPTVKAIVVHVSAANYYMHHGMAYSFMIKRQWMFPGYNWTTDENGMVNQNRKDNEKTWGVGRGDAVRAGYKRDVVRGSTDNGHDSDMIDLNWLGFGNEGHTKGEPIPGFKNADCEVAQFHSLYRLIYAYHKKYPNAKIYGHNNMDNKWCPGWHMHTFLKELNYPDHVIPGHDEYYDVAPKYPKAYFRPGSKYIKNAKVLAALVK